MLEDKDILQVDATIITGILILLTISNVAGITRAAQLLAAFVSSVIPVFSASAILVLVSRINADRPSAAGKIPAPGFSMFTASMVVMVVGFVALTSIIMLFFYVSYVTPDLLEKLARLHISSQNVTHTAKLAK